jgi:hypothetical protein
MAIARSPAAPSQSLGVVAARLPGDAAGDSVHGAGSWTIGARDALRRAEPGHAWIAPLASRLGAADASAP